MSAIETLIKGYSKTDQEEGQEADLLKKDNVEERELTAIEKLMNGYGKDGLQKEEAKIDPNEIKKEEKASGEEEGKQAKETNVQACNA